MGPTKQRKQVEELADAVVSASRVLVAVAARSLAEHEDEVSTPQFRSLVVLATRGPQRPVDLAAALGVDPSTVTRLCDRLARRGLISRRRRGTDRREVRLTLSESGAELVETVTQRRREEILRILETVPPDEAADLVHSFEVFSAAAEHTISGDRVWEL